MSAATPSPSGENSAGDRTTELRQLLEALFEERLAPAQLTRLEELVLGDPACRRFYLEYLDLHGNLYWDAAQGNAEPVLLATPIPKSQSDAAVQTLGTIVDSSSQISRRRSSAGRRRLALIWSTLAAAAIALLVAFVTWPTPAPNQPNKPDPVAANDSHGAPTNDQAGENRDVESHAEVASTVREKIASPQPRPSADESVSASRTADRSQPTSVPVVSATQPAVNESAPDKTASTGASAGAEPQPKDVVAFIDLRIKKGWKAAGIKPSPLAADPEWLRRVYLDIVGHIPPEEAVDAFLDDASAAKRSDVVAQLLKEPDYARNWATIWANLLVGRQPRARGVSRDMLEKFLRDSFAANVPWNEVVFELVSAEGTPEQNPATNFLLAHLNNDAVPATAMTARLFLGVQVQCTQCHDHPFQNDKQGRFWELKSFFQQTEMASPAANTAMSSDTPAAASAVPELVSRKVGGPLYYETRRGEMRVAYPVYAGHKIDPGPSVNRRRELARLIAKEDDRQVALAVVNRMWQHFFGYGFTRPVDDMGSHNPASHPEVLDRLADEFIASGYDLKQLCRWICATDAYQRASGVRPENRSDDPATGATPLFSRVYLHPMTAEELYDSLLLATRAKSSARTDWNDAGRRRQDWVRQFVINYGTDENDEATVPAGSVSQALVMMNDSIVRSALAVEPGTLLDDVLNGHASDVKKIRRLCRSALSRDPRPAELNAALEQLQAAKGPSAKAEASDKGGQLAQAQALQDIFWAFLNANEFAFVH